MTSKDELACTYSALILADDDVPITADKMDTILKAANCKVEPFWPTLFAKALSSVNVKDLITSVGSAPAGGAASAAPTGGATEGAAPAAAEAKEDKKESEEESEDDDMGFGLFD